MFLEKKRVINGTICAHHRTVCRHYTCIRCSGVREDLPPPTRVHYLYYFHLIKPQCLAHDAATHSGGATPLLLK